MSHLTEQMLKQLLDHDDIQARLKARSVPTFPASWKAGFWDRTLGRDAPWGDFQTAWSLLRMGRVEEGRELIRRLCKYHDTDRDNLALGAFELLRAPEDRAKSGRLLRKLSRRFVGCSEFHALLTIGLIYSNARLSYAAYQRNDGNPGSVFGTFLNDLRDVAISDIQHQILFGKVGDTIASVIVQPVVKGFAQFLLRNHEEALSMFARGYREADQMGACYVRILGKTLTQTQHESLAGMIQIVALKGLRLTLFDLGLDALATRVEELLEMERQLLDDIIVAGIVRESNPAT